MSPLRSCSRWSSRALVAGALAALTALTATCSDSNTLVAVQLNLDRPVDVAFACYGGLRLTNGRAGEGLPSDDVTVSAQPLKSCEVRSPVQAATAKPPLGQEDIDGGASLQPVQYFGFILQSGPGTVAIAQFPASPASSFNGNEVVIRDANPLTPGKNSISVGVRPVAIATDPRGCFAVTANAGSCDLSSLDINSALKLDGQARVSRLAVTNSAGTPIDARPAAMVAEPGLVELAEIGKICKETATGHVYVAYPGCHLVAVVNLATRMIDSGIRFDDAGVATIVDGTVTCPQECGAPVVPPGGTRPVTLDLVDDPLAGTRRLVIGANNSNKLTFVDLDPATSSPKAIAPLTQVPLFEQVTGKLGVLDVALSKQLGMGNSPMVGKPEDDATAAGGQFQFAYAVTTDGTVRVADLLTLKECDTQVDPRLLHDEQIVRKLSCLPVGAATTPRRRTGAIGPGIAVPGDGVAAAVNIFKVERDPNEADTLKAAAPTRLNGTFAVISSTSGASYLVDIDDDDKADKEVLTSPLAVDLSTTLPHQLREQTVKRDAVAEVGDDPKTKTRVCNASGPVIDASGAVTGGARLAGAVNRLTLAESVVSAKTFMLPGIRQVQCIGSDASLPVSELSYAAQSPGSVDAGGVPKTSPSPDALREAVFPDTRALQVTEDWRLVWEGALSADISASDIDGPLIRFGTVTVASQSMKITDRSNPFCAAGVEDFDQVRLAGCDPNTPFQCPLGTRCYLHPDAVNGFGACLPEKTADSLAAECRDFLVSIRRYTVQRGPKRGELVVAPRFRELRSTPLGGCTPAPVTNPPTPPPTAECQSLADYEVRQASELHPFELTAVTSAKKYVCEADPTRAPRPGKGRCIMTCTKDADCDSASVCDEAKGRCMEGVVPPPQCIAGIQRYELRAGEAFTVLGSLSGYVHPVIADAAGKCVVDSSPEKLLQRGRIPLKPDPCGSDYAKNPCLEVVPHAETVASYVPNTCTAADPATKTQVRMAPSIFFRNAGMSYHLVDPTYPGDMTCRGDRLGGLGDVPTTFTGLAFTFRQSGGFASLPLRTSATVPVRVLRGPQQSIWIVDEGDFLPENTNQSSTRGKVFRIESTLLGVVNIMQ
jgi:hypothetical protein